MEIYLLFATEDYYPEGGMKDFVWSGTDPQEALDRVHEIPDERNVHLGLVWTHGLAKNGAATTQILGRYNVVDLLVNRCPE